VALHLAGRATALEARPAALPWRDDPGRCEWQCEVDDRGNGRRGLGRVTAFRNDWLQQAAARPSPEDSDLHLALRLAYTHGGPTGGLFLRVERLHAQADGFTRRGRWSERIDRPILTRSHGEGFLDVLAAMSTEPGLYVLDEPVSALSFDSCLALLTIMTDMLRAGSQILVATHSPILAALPGADPLQLDQDGITAVDYDTSDVVTSWRSFLQADRYLRHLS